MAGLSSRHEFRFGMPVMNDIGMDGIMLNAPTPDDYRIAIPIARKHGIEVYAWLWTMNLEHDRDKILAEHPDWFSVNRNGKSLADTTAYVDYYKFLCPALPEVREFIREKIKEVVLRSRGIERNCHRLQPFGGCSASYHVMAALRYCARPGNMPHGITVIIPPCSKSSRAGMAMIRVSSRTLRQT